MRTLLPGNVAALFSHIPPLTHACSLKPPVDIGYVDPVAEALIPADSRFVKCAMIDGPLRDHRSAMTRWR